MTSRKKASFFPVPVGGTFLIFLLSNLFLSYGPANLEAKLWLGLFGLVLPFGLALLATPSSYKPLSFVESFSPPPAWVWVGLGILALMVRFFHLTTLTVWPHYDEATTGYYAMGLTQKGDGRLFYEASQTPPAYLWGLAVLFKALGVSLSTLWFFPALLSALTVPLAYLASRQFFSKSFSFILASGMAFSFWPLLMGRYSLMPALVLFWECLAWLLFGKFLNPTRGSEKKVWALALGSATGLGFYTGLHWIMIAAVIISTMGFLSKGKARPLFLWFLIPSFLFPLPLLRSALQQDYGLYFGHLWAFHQSIPLADQVRVSLSYLSCLFWGLDPKTYTFQPVLGGFLNPLLGSLFFLGVIELWRCRTRPFYLWLGISFVFFMLPGVLTKECEPLRVMPVLPVLLVILLLGLQRLAEGFPRRLGGLFLLLLLTLSFGLDFYHLAGKYHQLWDSNENWKGYAKSIERYRAYGILAKINAEKGPGFVFSNFATGLCDQSLSVADFAFNALENPAIPQENARWAAVLTNVNYRPFLEKRFGPGEAYALSRDSAPSDGGWMLWVVALGGKNREDFQHWALADKALAPFIDASLSGAANQSYRTLLAPLNGAYPSFKGDSFLMASYWEKTSELFVKESFQKPGDVSSTGELGQGIQALEKALRDGYPSAHLYNHLGFLHLLSHNEPGARKAFQEALKAPLNLTNSAQYLP